MSLRMRSGRVLTGPCFLLHLCAHKFHIPLTDIWDLVSYITLTFDLFSRPSVMSFIDIWELKLWATQDPHGTFKLCHALGPTSAWYCLLLQFSVKAAFTGFVLRFDRSIAGHRLCFFLNGLGMKMTHRNWQFCPVLVLKVWAMTSALEEALPTDQLQSSAWLFCEISLGSYRHTLHVWTPGFFS